MAILSTSNLLSEQRYGVDDARRIESAVRNDFDTIITALHTNTSQGYIVRGFYPLTAGAIGAPANSLELVVDPGAVLHIAASVSGTIFQTPTGTPNQILNAATNPNVSGSFAANSTNYVGIDYNRFADSSTDITKYIWNSSATDELTTIAPAAQTLTYKVFITTSIWAANVLPIAIISCDGNGNVLSITDARWMFCSLETGGINPNPNYQYPWSEGRTQPPVTITAANDSQSPFIGGDKQLTCMKDWMNAVMTTFLEIKGTPYWFTGPVIPPPFPPTPAPSITSLFQDLGNTVITGSGEISNGILPGADPVLVTTGNTITSGQYQFTTSSASATSGATYTNNGQTFTVSATVVSSTSVVFAGTGNPTPSGTLTKASGTGDATITFSAYTNSNQITNVPSVTGLAVGDFVFGTGVPMGTTVVNISAGPSPYTLTVSRSTTANVTGNTLTFYSPSAITSPGQINWDDSIEIRVIGSSLTYTIAANPSSTDISLTDDEVAYIEFVREVPITPNLVFTAGSNIVTSVGSVTWTSGLLPNDYVKVGTDSTSGYYQITTVNSGSQVTLATNVLPADNTGPGGIQAQYAYGSYEAVTPPAAGNLRAIQISSRETVPINGNTFWLFMREDNGSAPRVYIRFLSEELDNGESVEIAGTTSLELLEYIGSPSASTSRPNYTNALNPGSVPEIVGITVGAGSTISDSEYFLINSSGNFRNYYVWFNVSGSATDPMAPNTNDSIMVPITSGMTSTQVASAIATAFNTSSPGDFNASSGVGTVTVTNTSAGQTNAPSNFNVGAPFAIVVNQAGTGTGNFAIHDGDNLTLAIKELDQALGNIIELLDEPTYDETIDIVASGGTYPGSQNPPMSINGPIAADTDIPLPNNSRLGNFKQNYTVGKGVLEVYLNGQYLRLGEDWAEVGVSGTASNTIEILQGLVVGDSLEFRININGGGGGGGGGGTQGPPGPQGVQGPAGADAAGGPIAISTKTGPTTYTVLLSDCFLKANCAAGVVTFNLPSAASASGHILYFKKIDSSTNAMNITGAGSDTIDGATTQSTITQYTSFSMISDGSTWNIF